MATKTDEKTQQSSLDPRDIDSRFKDIMAGEGLDMTGYNDQAEAIERDLQKQREKEDQPELPKSADDTDGIRDAEESPDAIPFQPIRREERKKGFGGRFLGRNRALVYGGLGLSTGTLLIIAFLGALLPLKLDALISNMTAAASKVPRYAVEQRTEYLVTRALATRMLMLHNGVTSEVDGKLAFCGNGSVSVACSLFTTYTANVFEKQMDFNLSKTSKGVTLTVNPKGRQYLGGPATSWNIDLTRDGNWGNINDNITRTVRKIESHKDMRLYLRNTIDKKLGHKTIITRYLARKILMKKYGVRHWRAFETTREKWDKKILNTKMAIKVGLYENTVLKLSPRYGVWMSCFMDNKGVDACETLLKRTQAQVGTPPAEPPNPDSPEYDDYLRQKKQYDALQKIEKKVAGEVGEDVVTLASKRFVGFFTTKLLPALGVLDLVNMVMNVAKSVDDGVLTIVSNDMVAQAATGIAYGAASTSPTSGTGVLVNYEKMKAGDFTDTTGGEVVGVMSDLLDCEGSPLCAQQNGFLNISSIHSPVSAASGYQVECSTNGEKQTVILEPGELVCYNQRFNRDFTKDLRNEIWFQALMGFKDIWFGSGFGVIFNTINDLIGAAVGAAMDLLNQEPLKSFISNTFGALAEYFAPAIKYMSDLAFNPPYYGDDAPKGGNFNGVSTAKYLSENDLMVEGIGEDGEVWGGGGRYMSPEEVDRIAVYQDRKEEEYRNSLPWYARLFDVKVKGSLTQLALLQAPNTPEKAINFPSSMFASVMRSSIINAQPTNNQGVTNNPFNLHVHSYSLNDPVLTADPSVYTKGKCEELKQARLGSYTHHPEDPVGKTGTRLPTKVYAVADPCALEKMSVGASITSVDPAAEGALADPYSISVDPGGGGDGNATSTAAGWTREQLSQASDHIACAEGSEVVTESYTAHDDGKPIQIKLCKLTAVPVPSVASWNYEGVKVPVFASIISAKYVEMMKQLYEAGGRPVVLDSFRSYERQIEMRVNNGCARAIYDYQTCPGKPAAAVPGYSNHETGYATDFYRPDAGWSKVEDWLQANAATFCFEYLKSPLERWHWQPISLRTGAACT